MSGWTVQLDPPAVATARTMLDLNVDPIGVESIDWGDAAIQAYLADLAIGSSPVDYRLPNRVVTVKLMLGSGYASEELGREQLQQKAALFQREGGWLLRQRDGGPAMYADVINATLNLPDVWGETGDVEPDVTLTLECLPDFYGDEITLDSLAVTGVAAAKLQQGGADAVIAGDHPGRCRIIVTDSSGHAQDGVIWGFRSRHYDSGAHLFYEAEALSPVSPSTVATRTGASGGSVVRSGTLDATGRTILNLIPSGLGQASHLGIYDVWARVYTTATVPPILSLQWFVGAGGVVTNDPVAIPGPNAFYLVNLGTVILQLPAPASTPAWSGLLHGTGTGTDIVDVDAVYFQPLDETAGIAANGTAASLIYASDEIEIRSEGIYSHVPDQWGPAGLISGDLPRIPPSGLEARPVELLVKTTRGDLANVADSGLDAFSVLVKYRPCYLSRP